jgi:hypothetical protein
MIGCEKQPPVSAGQGATLFAGDTLRLGERIGPARCWVELTGGSVENRRAILEPRPTKLAPRPRPNHASLFALIQLMDPVNQIVITGCTSHDRVQLIQALIFRSVIKRHPRLSRVVPKDNFIPMDRLDL